MGRCGQGSRTGRATALWLALAVLLPAMAWATGSAPVPLRILFGDADTGLSVTANRLGAPAAAEPFLRSADVAAAFRLRRGWQPRNRQIVFESTDRRIVAWADRRTVRVDTVATLLRLPPRFRGGELWLPLEFVTRVLAPAVGQRALWSPERSELRIVTVEPDIVGLSIDTGPRRTVLRLLARRPLHWRVTSPAGGVLRLTAEGAVLDTAAVTSTRRRGLVLAVTPRPDPTHAVVDVSFSPLVTTYDTARGDGGRTLVVTLLEEEPTDVPLPGPGDRRTVPKIARETARPVRTVIIDPGHGGDDPGAGTDAVEKDVVLDVARELYRRLHREGLAVVLTRDDDVTLPDDQRAVLADRNGGDLFLSLHADWWPDPSRRGAMVRLLASLPDGGAEADNLFVRWERAQQPYLERSAELAAAVVDALTAAGWPTQGIRHGDLPLLRGIDMPAVMVELGYLSNTEDRRSLTRERGRRRLAAALAEAVLTVARRWEPSPAAEADPEVPR